MGHPKSLYNNLHRSLGAKNFATFWVYWNPVFGYYLGTKVFKPLKKIVAPAIALIFTFVFCGLVHDAVTYLVKGETRFLFAIWFLYMAVVLLITKKLKLNFGTLPWVVRALINCVCIGSCYAATYYTLLFNASL